MLLCLATEESPQYLLHIYTIKQMQIIEKLILNIRYTFINMITFENIFHSK